MCHPIWIKITGYIPIRAIAEALGGKVYWQQEQRTVTIIRGQDIILFRIDSPIALVNGLKPWILFRLQNNRPRSVRYVGEYSIPWSTGTRPSKLYSSINNKNVKGFWLIYPEIVRNTPVKLRIQNEYFQVEKEFEDRPNVLIPVKH